MSKVSFSPTIVERLRSYYDEEIKTTSKGEGFVVPNARRFLIRVGRKNIAYNRQKELFTHYTWSFEELLAIIQDPVNKFIIHESHHPFESLCQSIESGDIEEAKKAIEEGVDYTIKDCHIVYLAARHGKIQFMSYLFTLPKIDIVTENPMIPACEFGHFEIVKLLYDKGLDPSRDLCLGIRLAAQNGYLDVVKYLLEDERIDITCRSNYAIKKACEGNHFDVLKYLLEKKDLNAAVNDNHLLLIACQNNNEKIVKLLLSFPNVHVPNHGKPSLQMCGKYGYLKILNILLADPNLNPTVEVLQSALTLACSKGHIEVVKTFLSLLAMKSEAEKNYVSERSLSLACSSGHYDIVKLLIDKNKVNFVNFKITSAIGYKDEEIVLKMLKLLLAMDDRVSCDFFDLFSPIEKILISHDSLVKAVKSGFKKVVSMLLTKKPQESLTTKKKALVYAIESHKPEIVKILCLHDIKIIEFSHAEIAAANGEDETFLYLVNLMRFNVHRNGNCCFVQALSRGNLSTLKIITSHQTFQTYLQKQDQKFQTRQLLRQKSLELGLEKKDLPEFSSKIDRFIPENFHFEAENFIESLEFSLPYIDDSIIIKDKVSILKRTLQLGSYKTVHYLFEKWPAFQEEFIVNLSTYNTFQSNQRERKKLIIFSFWPILRLIYLMSGEDPDKLLKEISLTIMSDLINWLDSQ